MIRNITAGRTVYTVDYNDPRTLKHRPHVQPVTVTGARPPLNDGKAVVGLTYSHPRYGTHFSEALPKHLFPTVESAMADYRRQWGTDCERSL